MNVRYAFRPCSLLLCLLLTAFPPPDVRAATGPWTFLTPTPTGNNINDAYSPDGGTIIYNVGDGGLVLKQVGSTYTIMETGTTAPLKGISGNGPNNIWAVGGTYATATNTDPSHSVLLHFNGTTWSPTQPPLYSSYPDLFPMRDVWTSSTGQAYAVSDVSSLPAKWNAVANKWEFEDVPYNGIIVNGYLLYAIFGFADNDIYAVGTYGTILHRDANGWTPLAQFENEPSSMSFNLLEAVWGPDANHVFASGNSGQVYRLIKSQSATWETVNRGGSLFTAYTLASMAGTGPSDIWLVGSGGVIRHWNGEINNLAIYDDTSGKSRNSILPVGSGTYQLDGYNGLLERMDGSTAARTTLGTPAAVTAPWKSVAFAGKLWLAPQWSSAAIGVSTWSKGHLTRHPIAGLGDSVTVTAFKAFSSSDFWFSGVDNGSSVLLRGNGTTWSAWLPPGVYGSMGILDVVKTSTGGYGLIQYMSFNTGIPCIVGNQYMECPYSQGADASLYTSLAAGSAGDVYAVGTGGRVARWHNGAWSVNVIGANGDDLVAVAATAGMIVAVGQNGSAFYSTDGTTWLPVSGITRVAPIDGSSLYDFKAIVHAGSGVFWAVLTSSSHWIDGGKSSLYRIQNGQASLVQGGYTTPLIALAAATDQQAAFAAGEGGVVMTTNAAYHETGTSLPFLSILLQ